jgi:hypothetical protein
MTYCATVNHWLQNSATVLSIAVLTFTVHTSAQASTPTGPEFSLYKQIRSLTEANYTEIQTEEAVSNFALNEIKTEEESIVDEDVKDVLDNNIEKFCSDISCFSVAEIIKLNASLPVDMRDFGRELQLAATNYESGVAGIRSRRLTEPSTN